MENNDDKPGSLIIENNYVKIKRSGAGGNGGGVYLMKELDMDLTPNTSIKFDVNPVFSDVGAGWSDGEYPVNIYLYLTDSNNEEVILRFCYNYRGGKSKDSANYKQIAFPNCTQNEWKRDEQFTISDYYPNATKINKIRIGGNGWNFEGLIDNVSLTD